MKKILCKSLKNPKNFLRGFLTEFIEMAVKLIELFLGKSIIKPRVKRPV
jgi:hypothetical protein